MRDKRKQLVFATLLLANGLAGCVSSPPPAASVPETESPAPKKTEAPQAEPMPGSETDLPEVNPLELSGDIVTAGSSTVFPLAEVMVARFEAEGFAGKVTIVSIGSGAGFERFCVAGETNVSNASRPIKDSEVESCREIGREPIEFRAGTDALAVTVSQDNDFLTDVTLEELALIFGEVETWSEVNPDWPDEEILRYIPGTDSGTFDYFVAAIFNEDERPILGMDPEMSEDDNVLVQGIIGSPYAIGFFGYAYFAENTDVLKVLDVEGITPTQKSVDTATYPLARPLFMYSDATIMQSKPQVAGYINFFLTYVDEEILEVGYFPANPAALDQAKQNWLDAME